MDTLTLLIGGGLLSTAVVLYVILPLVQGREALMDSGDEEASEEEFRRHVALSALRDVEYDYATGKMDEEDYRRLKRELSLEALRILEGEREAMEKGGAGAAAPDRGRSRPSLPDASSGAGDRTAATSGGDAASEAPDEASPPTDELEAEIARIRRGLREGRACRACAQVNPPGSRFCGRCGEPLQAEGAGSAKSSTPS